MMKQSRHKSGEMLQIDFQNKYEFKFNIIYDGVS